MLLGCSATAADDSIAPVDEASADVVSVSNLIGEYRDGRGRFASLTLSQATEGGKKTNQFQAEVIVQCVTAPCPTQPMKGKWFARQKSLTLYPESGSSETYSAELANSKLTLENARGTQIGELTKVGSAGPSEYGDILSKHGVPRMSVNIDPAEVARQPGSVPFAQVFEQALGLFLGDPEGLPQNTEVFADELSDRCPDQDFSLCLANDPGARVTLRSVDEGRAPQSEDPKNAWILEFFVDHFTDHVYYVVVDKKGKEPAYIYAFN